MKGRVPDSAANGTLNKTCRNTISGRGDLRSAVSAGSGDPRRSSPFRRGQETRAEHHDLELTVKSGLPRTRRGLARNVRRSGGPTKGLCAWIQHKP